MTMGTVNALISVGALTWRPHLAPLLCGILLAAIAVWTVVIHRRMLTRMSRARALLLILPKVLILALLITAVFDPFWSTVRRTAVHKGVLVLLDRSLSMDVKDDGRESRIQRAESIAGNLKRAVPTSVKIKTLDFDSALHDPAERGRTPAQSGKEKSAAGGVTRGTDLAACLLDLSERSDLSSYAAAVVLTDGGDENVRIASIPALPLYIVGIGTDPSAWKDVAISEVHYPASVEKEVDFEISVDVTARTAGDSRFAEQLARVPIALEREGDGAWAKAGEQILDLSNKRVRASFRTSCPSTGPRRYRVRVAAMENELSPLNNSRTFEIDVRKKSQHVLFFSRELGSDLKTIRGELASDPGVTFTALFRTIGERFTVQGEQLPGAEDLEAGFPSRPEVLRLFDCIIIGSFPSDTWRKEQMEALVKYVGDGGSVVFLGGEMSFGRGRYAGTALAPLFPWGIGDNEPELSRGSFPVSVPYAAADHPIVSGLQRLLSGEAEAVVESANVPGLLKPGATTLMNVTLGNRVVSMVAVQRYGRGNVLAIATNTFWKWARKSAALRNAYGLFWRQTVRNLTGSAERGGIFSVKWDRDFYRPGERASAEVTVAGDQSRRDLRLTASLEAGGEVKQLLVEPAQGQAGAFKVEMAFRQRGAHHFSLSAHHGQDRVESYERDIHVSPLLEEGSRLEVDERFLASVAEKSGGAFAREGDYRKTIDELIERNLYQTVVSDRSLICGNPYFVALFLAILAAEWILRRKSNLF